VSGLVPGLFLVSGLHLVYLGFSDSPYSPQAVSVENQVLEIEGLESRSGLTMDDFHSLSEV